VTNTGGALIPRVVVQDVFPQFVNFTSGPGNFNTNTKTLTFEVTNLNVGESRTFALQGQVVSENDLPQNTGIACVTNQAIATTNMGQSSYDNAQLCIERPGQPSKGAVIIPPSAVPQIPVTGPDVLQIVGLGLAGMLGFIIRKKTALN
jgi:hypothetical protein